MRGSTAIRWTGAWWFVPLLFALSCLNAASGSDFTGYSTADIALASFAVSVSAPIAAVYVAYRFHDLLAYVRPIQSARSGLRATTQALWPLVLGIPVAVTAAVLVTARTVPDAPRAWLALATLVAEILAAVLFGVAAGWCLPPVFATPIAALAVFVWVGYGPASGSPLLHTLQLTAGNCCSPETQPTAVSLIASLLVAAVLCGGVTLLLMRVGWARIRRWTVVIATPVVVGAAFGTGAIYANASGTPLTVEAVEPRTTPLSCDVVAGIHVCLWPEEAARRPEIAAVAGRINDKLAAAGFRPISKVTSSPRVDGVTVAAAEGVDERDLGYSLAAGYVDWALSCRGAYGGEAQSRVAFVMLAAGRSAADVRHYVPVGPAQTGQRRFAKVQDSPASTLAWFDQGLTTMACGPTP